MKVLVTGGAGFIGSHTCVRLIEEGYEPIIADNFSNSHISVINQIAKITGTNPALHAGDLCESSFVNRIFAEEQAKGEAISAIIHFAAYKSVGEMVS